MFYYELLWASCHQILTTNPVRGLVHGIATDGLDDFVTSSLPTGGPALSLPNLFSTWAPERSL